MVINYCWTTNKKDKAEQREGGGGGRAKVLVQHTALQINQNILLIE